MRLTSWIRKLAFVAIIWSVHHYPIPFHQLWINFPTWLLGVLATGVYYARQHRK